jgi:hypothetical protein
MEVGGHALAREPTVNGTMLETILGDTLIHDGSGTTPYYSPPFGRGGDAAVFTIEVAQMNGTPTLVFAVEHKNAEDTSWSSAGSTSATATGVHTLEVSGLKEELRLKFTFSAGVAGDFVHLLVPAPMWLPF